MSACGHQSLQLVENILPGENVFWMWLEVLRLVRRPILAVILEGVMLRHQQSGEPTDAGRVDSGEPKHPLRRAEPFADIRSLSVGAKAACHLPSSRCRVVSPGSRGSNVVAAGYCRCLSCLKQQLQASHARCWHISSSLPCVLRRHPVFEILWRRCLKIVCDCGWPCHNPVVRS